MPKRKIPKWNNAINDFFKDENHQHSFVRFIAWTLMAIYGKHPQKQDTIIANRSAEFARELSTYSLFRKFSSKKFSSNDYFITHLTSIIKSTLENLVNETGDSKVIALVKALFNLALIDTPGATPLDIKNDFLEKIDGLLINDKHTPQLKSLLKEICTDKTMLVTYIRKENITPKNPNWFIIPSLLLILPIVYYYYPIFAEHSLIELITIGTAYLFAAVLGISTLVAQKEIYKNNLDFKNIKTSEITDALHSLTQSFKFKLIETEQIAEGDAQEKNLTNTYFEIVTEEKPQSTYAHFKERGLNPSDYNSPASEAKKETSSIETHHKPTTWANGLLNSQQPFLKKIRRAGFNCYSYCQEAEVIKQMEDENQFDSWRYFQHIADHPKFCSDFGQTGIKSIPAFPGLVEINGKFIEIEYKWEMKVIGKGGNYRIYGYELPADLQETGEPGPPIIIFSVFSRARHKLKDEKALEQAERKIAPPLKFLEPSNATSNLPSSKKMASTKAKKEQVKGKQEKKEEETENKTSSQDSSCFTR